MIANDLAEVVAELEGVAHLWQLASGVISNGKATVQLNERNAFYLGTNPE